MLVRTTLLAATALALVAFTSAGPAFAKRGADDAVPHARHGADDPVTHDATDDKGVDNPATHDVNDDKGVDDPATHDVNDDSAAVAAASRRVEHPPEVQPPEVQPPEPAGDRRRGRR